MRKLLDQGGNLEAVPMGGMSRVLTEEAGVTCSILTARSRASSGAHRLEEGDGGSSNRTRAPLIKKEETDLRDEIPKSYKYSPKSTPLLSSFQMHSFPK